MARVQTNTSKAKTSTNKSGNAPQKKAVSKKNSVKVSPQREPSKNEILFFKIGMSIIVLTFLAIGTFFLIQYFTQEEAERLTDNMTTKIFLYGTTLRERVASQCEINKKHDDGFK